MTIPKTIEALDEGFLQELLSNRVEESETLDYKLEMYGSTDSDHRELLRDVTAFANNRGGVSALRYS